MGYGGGRIGLQSSCAAAAAEKSSSGGHVAGFADWPPASLAAAAAEKPHRQHHQLSAHHRPHPSPPQCPPHPPPVHAPARRLSTMLSRSTVCRGAQRALTSRAVRPAQRRGLAAPASGSFQYETGDAKGVKFASRNFAGPTTTLALVAKAGTRFQPLPGLTEGLEQFAFKVRH